MTERERRVVEDLLKEINRPAHRHLGFTYNQIHDMYEKLERVGLMPLPKENTQCLKSA
jgi:hypothetical protein